MTAPGTIPTATNATSSGRRSSGTCEQAGQDEGRHDGPDERDRPPAHGQVAEQLDVGIEVEGDDGDRHGGDECIQGRRRAPRRPRSRRPSRACRPADRLLSADGSPLRRDAHIIGPIRRSNAGGVRSAMKRPTSLGAPSDRYERVRPAGKRAGRRVSGGRTTMAAIGSGPNVRLAGRPPRPSRCADGRRSPGPPSGSPCPGALRAARADPPTALTGGDRRRPVAGCRRRIGRIPAPGTLARAAGPRRGRASRPTDCSTSTATPSGSGSMRGSTSMSRASRPAWSTTRAAPRPPSSSTTATCSKGLGHDCFAAERERLSDRYEDALAIVAERRLEACDLVGARAAADRLLERDPLREEAHAVLIAVHGQIGSRSQVVRQHRRLQDVLGRELGEAPLPDTEAIYRQALDSTMRRALERPPELEPGAAPVLVAVGHWRRGPRPGGATRAAAGPRGTVMAPVPAGRRRQRRHGAPSRRLGRDRSPG